MMYRMWTMKYHTELDCYPIWCSILYYIQMDRCKEMGYYLPLTPSLASSRYCLWSQFLFHSYLSVDLSIQSSQGP